ncbi:MAG: DUF4861 domain-containing protein [Prevotella sp.]|nr:DUF4861 domain-containing protein [Prevotella sp.]
MKQLLTNMLLFAFALTANAQKTIQITVSNPLKTAREAAPVVIPVDKYGFCVKSALVTCEGKEVPCQLDDMNGDGEYDELCFITDLAKKEKKAFSIELLPEGEPRAYKPQVYVEMMLSNKKVKESNKQDLYISQLTVENGTNAYWMIHHHGAAFESEKVAYRIYFDHRQTVDIYGKYHQGLELKQTQFYPDQQQKDAGFGDDVLWVGSTFGVGTLRGWNGTQPTMLEDVDHRTQKIIARGPLRTVVEVVDDGWKHNNAPRIKMTTRYTLFAGHRDCQVDITFNKPVTGHQFATGIINVKNSTEFSDKKGLRGCWGTDWPVSEKDSAGHKRETVGLGICIPAKHIVSEMPADKDNYGFVVSTPDTSLHYDITFCSDNEDFGFHTSAEWYAHLTAWKKELENPVIIR